MYATASWLPACCWRWGQKRAGGDGAGGAQGFHLVPFLHLEGVLTCHSCSFMWVYLLQAMMRKPSIRLHAAYRKLPLRVSCLSAAHCRLLNCLSLAHIWSCAKQAQHQTEARGTGIRSSRIEYGQGVLSRVQAWELFVQVELYFIGCNMAGPPTLTSWPPAFLISLSLWYSPTLCPSGGCSAV